MSALSDALNEANVHGWSSREIARRAGTRDGKERIHHATVARFLNGRHSVSPSDDVLGAFVEVFPSLTLQQLRQLAGRPPGEDEPYVPPAEAALLSGRQRRAIDELIRSMVGVETISPEEYDEWTRLGAPRGIAWKDWSTERGRVLEDDARAEEDLDEAVAESWREESGGLADAARQGRPNLRSVRDQQDQAGEAPDPDGPEDGA